MVLTSRTHSVSNLTETVSYLALLTLQIRKPTDEGVGASNWAVAALSS